MADAISTMTKAPSAFQQILHATPSNGDMLLHGVGLAFNAGFAGYAVYKLATDKKLSTMDKLGYVLGLALAVPCAAWDIQRLIFNQQVKQRNPKTIQKALAVLNHENAIKGHPLKHESTYHPFAASLRA